MKKFLGGMIPAALLLSVSLGFSASAVQVTPKATAPTMIVSYIDVGQGDSELIQQGGQSMLIDTGTSESQSALLKYLSSRKLSKINYLVLTHPHADHIGGAAAVIKKYKIGTVYMPNITTTTSTFAGVLKAISAKGLKITRPVLGSKFKIGAAQSVIYGPVDTNKKDLNTFSIVLKVTFGKTRFLFTGDAQASNESAMIAKGFNLASDVLKIGHHGSNTSTSAAFLKAVKPKYGIIEVGKGNDYGHPAKATLSRLASFGVKVSRTDLQGTIVATSNGSKITFKRAGKIRLLIM